MGVFIGKTGVGSQASTSSITGNASTNRDTLEKLENRISTLEVSSSKSSKTVYNASGAVAAVVNGDGSGKRILYNADGSVSSVVAYPAGGLVYLATTSPVTAVGDVALSVGVTTKTYTYDSLGRVSQITIS